MNYNIKLFFSFFGVYDVQAKIATLRQRTVPSVTSMKNKKKKKKQKPVHCGSRNTCFPLISDILWLSFPKPSKAENILCSCYSGSLEESVDLNVSLAKHTTLCGKEQLSDQRDKKTTIVLAHWAERVT